VKTSLERWRKPAVEFARRPSWVISLIIVVAFAILAVAAPFTGLPRPEAMAAQQYLPPGADHWMGTDNFGRDLFSRVVWGTRLALQVAIISSALATLVGILLGSLSGYFGGWVDALMSRTFDVFLLIPAFFLVLLIVALFGSSIYLIMLAIAATDWPRAARIMRAQVLTLKSRTYVQAAIGAGASHTQILFRHVIPNGLPPIITNATLLMGLAILTEAGLSFLGLGDQNTTSWGRMIFEGQRQLRIAPWMSIFPGAAMLLLVGALNLVGDGLNQVLNPQLRAPEQKKAVPPVKAAPEKVEALAERPLLQVSGLRMHYRLAEGWVRAVDGISFAVPRGGSLGIVGESGCGKSSLGLTLMQVLPPNAHILGGEILFDGKSVRDPAAFAAVRWKRQSMIFQSAMNALNPVLPVRQQLREAFRFHRPEASRADAQARIDELFDLVGIPRWRMDAYPHELSGGMRQRVMIALGLLHNPDLIIADEPTTALDVLIQDQIMGEIDDLRRRLNLSLILISHDMGMVAETCDRVAVMYAGELVEQAPTDEIFARPRHPYTRALIESLPRLTGPKHQLTSLPGEPFVPIGDPVGCRFAARCAMATELCRREAPPELTVVAGHVAACHYALDAVAEPRRTAKVG
jgi:peptide/nickel transport system permease protein